MEIVLSKKIFYDYTKEEMNQLLKKQNAVVITQYNGVARGYLLKEGVLRLDLPELFVCHDSNDAELFARAYVDSRTMVTFDDVLREALTEVKDLLPDVYEAYTQQYKSALKKYKELRPLENSGKADLAQIIVSANVFQRKLQKFINKNIHFLD